MFERFTDRARKVMQLANQAAQQFNHEYLGTEHVLLGMIEEGEGVAAKVLEHLGLDRQRICEEVEQLVQKGPEKETATKLPSTPRTKQLVENALQQAKSLQHNYVGTEHLLLASVQDAEGLAGVVLANLGVNPKQIRNEVLKLLGHGLEIEQGTIPKVQLETLIGVQRLARAKKPTRILDASANRATEGLRVVEDYVRFVLDDGFLTSELKQLRHDLAASCTELLGKDRYAMRDTQHDVGTEISTDSEASRLDAWDVCIASLERTKQSLRSLEEYTKVPLPFREADYNQGCGEGFLQTAAQNFEALRYRLYTLEKALTVHADSCSRLREANLCVLIDGMKTVAEFTACVESLLDAGVGMVQLRDKGLADRKLLERASLLKSLTTNHKPQTTLTILNDRPDIAVAAGTDGVHLGQDDLDVKSARSIVGPRKLIGVSTHSIEQARQAVLDGANYLGAGPTFPSSTKSFDEFPGLDYLRQVAAEISLPTFAIGGIDVDNLPQVLETGITRVAVSSAASSAAELLELLRDAE